MRHLHILLLLCISCVIVTVIDAKTVFRRTENNISEKYKKAALPPEEIDPNVAPPEPQKIQTINPESVITSATASDTTVEVAATPISVEVVDLDANTIEDNVDEVTDDIQVPVSSTAAPSQIAVVAETTTVKNELDNGIAQYCKCTESVCDCCREFRLPLLPIVRGPGCARVAFLGDDKMSVSLKYGDLTLASRTVSGKRTKPICVGLPGGYSQFCGRVYNLQRSKDNNFKACLGFELRADDEVEAAVRVSCFKFGKSGLRVAEGEPLPGEKKDEEDEDDDDDIFGFGADTEDEEEEDEEDDYADGEENDDDEDIVAADEDYGGFSLGSIIEELAEDDDRPVKKPATKTNGLATPAVVTPANGETRHAQGKEEATIAANVGVSTEAPVKEETTKKNKKRKKSSSEVTVEYALEFITGVLEFFQ